MSSKRCPSCGVYNPATAERCDCGQSLTAVMAGATERTRSTLEPIGLIMMGVGIAIWVFCLIVFDVGIQVADTTGPGADTIKNIANMERVDRRQSGVTIGAAFFVAGAVLFASSRRDA